MKLREAVYVLVALGLVVIYASLGSRVAPLLVPAASPTPTPTKPVERVEAPRVSGTIAFVLRGDVYVLSGGGYVPLTSEGRSLQPNVSTDGKTVVFSRTEQIDGRRVVDGQVVPALLRFTNIVRKDAAGGPETVVVSGLVRAQSGFHEVTWFNAPALSPDGKRIAVTFDVGDGVSDLALYDAQSGRRMTTLSQGSNLSDPAWSPDGKTIAVTSYTLGAPRLLLVAADGRAANPFKIVPNGEPYRPAYSPDGDWILYTLRHGGNNDLHLAQLSRARDIALTTDGRSWNGVFSPDGRQVAFLREQNGSIDLFAMDLGEVLSGGLPRQPVKLTRGEGLDGESRPAWGP
ncbi:MAG: hypothetical protein E6I40_10825 [Chloroflexi bacterium]|nr:MAG: hypothetical protein E6I40_10825 [Chloroflexota bacterium]TMF64556.1 MAG: hypothetical protein E6I20_07760 [Chloroflexota bacterium]TMG33981.1 MAG: hypothetical protein E6H94_09945 [Chloroflexota bacterium]TMG36776.1 MAG: hypothetical protein E6H88_08780 [Chloroflexota bacterium]